MGSASSINAPSKAPPVTGEESEKLKSEVRNMVKVKFSSYYPEVIISYATGERKRTDGKGAGPGLVCAAEFIRALRAEGIDSFSGLHIPPGEDWETFMLRLSGRKSKAKVILALLTKAFYTSPACLDEMNEACKKNVRILPIRLEQVPEEEAQWENLYTGDDAKDDELELKIKKAQKELERNSIPAPGQTFFTVPDTAWKDILKALRDIAGADVVKKWEANKASRADESVKGAPKATNMAPKATYTTQGKGTFTGTNGNKFEYIGELKDGKPNGKGKAIWPNGDAYEGEWKDGKMHGRGKIAPGIMATCTKVNGGTARDTVMERKPGSMVMRTKVNGRTARCTAVERLPGIMATCTKVNGGTTNETRCTAVERKPGAMVMRTKVNGRTARCTAVERLPGIMATCTKVNGGTTRDTVMERKMPGSMVMRTKVNGRTARCTAVERFYLV